MTTVDIARLTPQERLDLIGKLWDSLSSEDIHLTAKQERELDRRMSSFDTDMQDAVPWEQIDAELSRRPR
jgi:putative addiction module component (TIGR02574 family)